MSTEAAATESSHASEPHRPTPDDFARLSKKEMLAELRRLGIAGGKRKKKKTALVSFYRKWYGEESSEVDEEDVRSEPAPQERRATPRKRIEVEIGLQTETNFFVGFSGDISEGGIFVTTVTILPIGTSVTCSFAFPGGIEVEAEGDVAWTREGYAFDSDLRAGMGIRFTKLSDEALAAIKEFTSIREPIFYDE